MDLEKSANITFEPKVFQVPPEPSLRHSEYRVFYDAYSISLRYADQEKGKRSGRRIAEEIVETAYFFHLQQFFHSYFLTPKLGEDNFMWVVSALIFANTPNWIFKLVFSSTWEQPVFRGLLGLSVMEGGWKGRWLWCPSCADVNRQWWDCLWRSAGLTGRIWGQHLQGKAVDREVNNEELPTRWELKQQEW